MLKLKNLDLSELFFSNGVGYKSLKSFPQDELIKKDIILKTKNFESLIYLLSQ